MTIRSASVTLITHNLIATRKFYQQHFGAQPLFDCGWYVVMRLGAMGAPELCLMEPQQGAKTFAGGAFINLEVTDVNHLHSQLTGLGLSPTVPLEDHPWGDRGSSHFRVDDAHRRRESQLGLYADGSLQPRHDP